MASGWFHRLDLAGQETFGKGRGALGRFGRTKYNIKNIGLRGRRRWLRWRSTKEPGPQRWAPPECAGSEAGRGQVPSPASVGNLQSPRGGLCWPGLRRSQQP